jgi:hypothetical protein
MNDFPEFDDLPDDPEVAFVRLYERYRFDFQENLEDNSKDIRAHYADFMNSIIGIAEGLGIDGFGEWAVPDEWDEIYPVFTGFDRAVKRYVMKIKVAKSRVTKVYSVHLTDEEKERIHSLSAKIREIVTASDLEERKRNSLFAKLAAFEADVDRSRTRFDNAMLMSLAVMSAVDKGLQSLNPLNELLRRIHDVMSKAKDKDPEQNQLPAPSEQKKLEAPQKKIDGPTSTDMDDEIPF